MLKRNIRFGVDRRFVTTWMVTLYNKEHNPLYPKGVLKSIAILSLILLSDEVSESNEYFLTPMKNITKICSLNFSYGLKLTNNWKQNVLVSFRLSLQKGHKNSLLSIYCVRWQNIHMFQISYSFRQRGGPSLTFSPPFSELSDFLIFALNTNGAKD